MSRAPKITKAERRKAAAWLREYADRAWPHGYSDVGPDGQYLMSDDICERKASFLSAASALVSGRMPKKVSP